MRKGMLILSLLIITSSSYGQLKASSAKLEPILLNLKSLIEKHFSGKNIRDLREAFVIEYNSSSNKYTLVSNANGMLPHSNSNSLNTRINQLLRRQEKIKLIGSIYFDKYSDSTLVDIEYFKEEEVYQFYSMESPPQPPGGLKAFSKRLHDFLKEQIEIKELVKDSILAQEKININVDRAGALSRKNKDYLSSLMDAFLKSEKRWNPSIHSGPPVNTEVEFRLLKEYLTNATANWPILDEFSEYVNTKLVTRNKIGDELTFYSTSFPRKFSDNKYTIVSLIYDSMLGKYRLPSIHSGSQIRTNKLISEIFESSSRNIFQSEIPFQRMYFYRN